MGERPSLSTLASRFSPRVTCDFPRNNVQIPGCVFFNTDLVEHSIWREDILSGERDTSGRGVGAPQGMEEIMIMNQAVCSLGVALFAGSLACACATEVVSEPSTETSDPKVVGASGEKEIPLLDAVPDKELPLGFDETRPYMEYRLRDGRHVVIISALKPGSETLTSDISGDVAEQREALSTVNVFPSQDTWVRRSPAAPTLDFGRSCELRVNNIVAAPATANMALLRFPIPAVVTCATIVSANLLLTTAQNPVGANTLVVFPHRINQPWVPGTTGFLGCATCNVSTGAGQQFALPAFTAVNPGVPVNQPCTTYSWNVLPLVAGGGGWCAAPGTNFGVLMAGRNGTAVVSFHSNEAPVVGTRPRLVITY
jgi:hypothetical protein